MDILTSEDNSTEQRLMNSRLSCIAHLKYKVLSVVLHCALLFNGERFLHWQCPTVFDHNVCRGPIIGTSLHILNGCDNILQAARTTESIIKTLFVPTGRKGGRGLTIPLRTFPNTTCLPSSHWVLTVVMKNWEPLVSLPALAMLIQPGPSCFSLKFSSGNLSPYILLPGHKYNTMHLFMAHTWQCMRPTSCAITTRKITSCN